MSGRGRRRAASSEPNQPSGSKAKQQGTASVQSTGMSSGHPAKRRVESTETALEAALIKQQGAEVALDAAKKGVKLAEMEAEHAKMCLELEELREAHASCEDAASADAGPPAKKPRASAPDASAALPEQEQQQQDLGDVEHAQQGLEAARSRLLQLSEKVAEQRRLQKETACQLADLRSTHRDCKVAAGGKGKELKLLRCTSQTIVQKAKRKAFLSALTTAPSIKSLSLHLLRDRDKPLPKSVLETLPRAPARIKQLLVTFGRDSEEAVLALLQRCKEHLEELHLNPLRWDFARDDYIRRFWGIVEDSNIAKLSLPADPFLRDVAFPFQAEKWCHLRSLTLTGYHLSFSSKDKGQKSVLAPLLRVLAKAASLRVFELPWDVAEGEREDVFAALAQCSELQEVSTPCYKQLAQLRGCAKLRKLEVHRVNMSDREGTDAEIQAAADFFKLPSTADRVESLSLKYFQLSEKRVLPLFRALRALKKLKSLSLELVWEFPEMEATLKSLPCLEELRLIHGHWMYPETVCEIKPEMAPNLKLLELDTEQLEEDEQLESWRDEVRSLEWAFKKKNKDFKLIDKTSFSPPQSSFSDDSGDAKVCKCGAKDASFDSDGSPPKCTCGFSSDNDTP
ncbi:uncharacterized protein LOC117641137 [Thrips palmi]|uniref:Uncharacterized protein LOC117641137 n=1 Tax=Thrips palmi TaxID=161013 RepID=A0A6P8YCV8_THRPL|nr:uncharacterized protein LOC117641137 [Thrips palmi]XP_034234158.1 uncharacterized protein LOC117641137 [Thrips palmi]XP_034234169.1 uncharacterized protein LOC117641137 [Thrips palmi]XP_034234178.1 uncharacterized protein LOC117641137 [Thrips palmi]XP_034234186.1 uncharacterized protein LOC117641137 [Thrips palmi]XP_034234193.1 uncharacterized protein LOC117641137 [Thrips palmi]XP_034234200.1 uncharacterized protein LOC117641137 [Thrips palmi]XP_034234208.1 uncharacterized protein LOC1176